MVIFFYFFGVDKEIMRKFRTFSEGWLPEVLGFVCSTHPSAGEPPAFVEGKQILNTTK